MPLMTTTASPTPVTPVVETVKVQPKEYKGVTVDTKLVPASSLVTHLEGQSWIVDYYSQVVARDTSVGGLQVGLNEVYQPYRLIRGFEFKVSDPLTPNQNSTSKEMSLTGGAKIYGVLIPNEGDMFIADIGDGREGLFQVTTSTRLSIYEGGAHQIEYSIVGYNTKETAADLNSKVCETLYFDIGYLRQGYNPLIHDKTVDTIAKLESHYVRLLTMYFNDFYSREHNTVIIPNQDSITYDPFIVKFLMNILSTDEHPLLRHVKLLNVSSDQAMYEMTLWNCLETMDYGLLPMVTQEMGIVSVKRFFSRPMFNSIYYTRVQSVIYPLQHQTNVDAGYHRTPVPYTEDLVNGDKRFQELKRLIQQTSLLGDDANGPVDDETSTPDILPVTTDRYYVFTEAFYTYESAVNSLTLLENLTCKALRGEPLDLQALEHLCSRARFWDNLERFYYLPVLFVLLKVYPRGL